MAFSVNVLTASGLEVIATATSTNKVSFTRVMSSANALSESEASDAEIQDFEGPEGPIVAASAFDNVARVVGSVTNDLDEAVTLKSFALCGRTESGSERVLAVLSDENAAVILAPSSGPASTTAIAFNIAFSISGELPIVQVTSAGSASINDLARFVSTRSAGDPSVGDDQDVLGKKDFKQLATFTGGLSAQTAQITSLSSSSITTAVLTSNVYVSTPLLNARGVKISEDNDVHYVLISANSTAAKISALHSGVPYSLSFDVSAILPNASGTTWIGSLDEPFEAVHADGISLLSSCVGLARELQYGVKAVVTGMRTEQASDDLQAVIFSQDDNKASIKVSSGAEIHTAKVVMTLESNTVLSAAYNNTYAGFVVSVPALSGLELSRESGTNVHVPVGGLVALWLEGENLETAGSDITLSTGAYVAKVTADGYVQGTSRAPGGVYRCVFDIDVNRQDAAVVALCVRIS